MSIYFDFDVGPKGRRFRRAVDQDKTDIDKFWRRKETRPLFNVDDIGSLIELSTLSICMIDKDKEVTGFMSLSDHPNLPGVDPAAWEIWIRNMFQRYYLSRNTLFIHFACCKDYVSDYFVEEALVSVFLNDAYLLQIVLVVPPECPQETLAKFSVFKKKSVFQHCASKSDDKDKEYCYSLYVALRNDFCPRLKMRRAVEEDNDEVVEILDKQSKRLKDLYGEYYISEIIGRHPEMHRKILVAEIMDRVVGVMSLNTAIDYNKLQHLYELTPYYGLKTVPPLEKEHMTRSNEFMQLVGEPIMRGHIDPLNPLPTPTTVTACRQQLDDSEIDERVRESSHYSRRGTRASKVRYKHNESQQMSEASSVTPRLSKVQNYSAITLLEEDAFDYEIINIDTQLISALESTLEYALQDKKRKPSNLPKEYERFNKRRISRMIRERKKSYNPEIKQAENDSQTTGSPNAFMVELFAMRDDVDQRRAYDMLAATFDCLKTYEYCLIRVPCSGKSFPLLQHFSLVPTKDNVCCNYSLYVAHRNSVLGKLRVRRAEFADIPQLSCLFVNLDAKQTIYTVESAIKRRKSNNAYVLLCGLSIIGLAIVELPTDINPIRMMFTTDAHHHHKYHVEAQGVASGFSALKTVFVYPAFEPHYRFFMREVMRLSGSSALLWMTTYRNKLVAFRANAVVSAMVPLLPRKGGFQTNVPAEFKKMMGSAKSASSLSFSTWLLSKKLTSIPKVNVDTRIVVVGASRTAMAFINTLVFGDCASYLTFTNLTLVSQNGIPYVRHPSKDAELMFLRHRTQADKYLKIAPYTYYVNVVYGMMCQINRQDKYILLDNGHKYYYDKLFLLVGMQYQHPDYLKVLQERENDIKRGVIPPYIRMDVPKVIDYEPSVADCDTPENVFIINTIADATKALHYVRGSYWRCDDVRVIIYGASIEAYCCITSLLEVLSADEIIFVEAFPPQNPTKPRVSVFSNEKVDKTVSSIIKELNIKCYRGYYFELWQTDADNIVTDVDFVSHTLKVTLECSALFYYGKRGVNTQAFVAVNKCGLAYDGGILIDHEFRTNDLSIYSAGPATRYRRKYFSEYQRQKFYDSYEVGERLGKQIKDELDPLFSKKLQLPPVFNLRLPTRGAMKRGSPDSIFDSSETSSESSMKVPAFSKLPEFFRAVKWHCILPGGMQYLEIRSPGPKYPHQYIQTMEFAGYILETFETGYFKLHLNEDFVVDGLTCLTPERYSLESFKNLYGLPSVMLNNVALRYFSNKIKDLFEFFRAPWAVFLYHEQAHELISVAKQVVPEDNPKNLSEGLNELANTFINQDPSTSPKDLREKLRSNFERHHHVAAVTDHVIEWLTDNDMLMSAYLRPWQMVQFEHDLNTSAVFKKRRATLKKMLAFIKPTDNGERHTV